MCDFHPDEDYSVLATMAGEDEEEHDDDDEQEHGVKLEALVPEKYDEDAAIARAMEQSKGSERPNGLARHGEGRRAHDHGGGAHSLYVIATTASRSGTTI
ncbi:hypothetical protein QYE76_031186 [Lolium multiflorum]|uniref:Uncharacterized protein n=1 Tax=Lolium multiflorum TaxID=4521 RepID=A0AAD8QUS2_LOLMU|nr:hypothetical protein QYE76_031186 [Lolium multiflorum]